MRAATLLAIAGLTGALAPATAAHAQVSTPVHLVTMERTMESAERVEPVRHLDDRTVNARLESAERAMANGNEYRARKLYETLAKDLEAEGRLATVAVWRLAAIRFAAGEADVAAAMLDKLAADAAAHDDVGVQVAALFEASHVYTALGKRADSGARVDEGVRLLVASALPIDTRVALLKRVGG
jgi:hypothetical protein